jgi:hypothetical protein
MADRSTGPLVHESRNQAPQQTPSYFSSLRNKTSQFSLRSIYSGDHPNSSHTADGIIVQEDTTLRPTPESTRFFPFGRLRPSSRYGATIRLEGDEDGDRNVASDVEAVAATGVDVRRSCFSTRGVRRWFKRRPVLRAAFQMSGIFIISTLVLGGTLWLALPKLEE